MTYEIQRKQIPRQPIVFVSGGGSPQEIPNLLAKFLPRALAHAQASGAEMAGPPFTHYLSMGERIEIQAGIPVKSSVEPSDDVEVGHLPGGDALVTTHIGPYDQLPKAYAALARYVDENGLDAADTMFEYYWSDPGEEPDPNNWKTEIFLPLR